MRSVAIVQARMGSTRLPGKVLLELAGEPMLTRCVNRVGRGEMVDEFVVATTVEDSDDAIERLCISCGWHCFRGDENDVLDRFYHAAVAYQADVVVHITSDCPLIDPEIVDIVIKEFVHLQPNVDYVCNFLPTRSFPRGLDTEVMRFDVLERAWREDLNTVFREHVTPYIRTNPGLFHLHGIRSEVDYSYMRWTVDTFEDLIFVRNIYNFFGHDHFSWREVVSLLEKHPEWLDINRDVNQKVV